MTIKSGSRVEKRLNAIYNARRKFLRVDPQCVMVYLFNKKIEEILEQERRDVS